MKKLLLLFMILGMVSVANAGMIDIVISSLNGQPIDPTNEITIAPTDEINMDIVYTGDVGRYLFGVSVLISAEGPGTLNVTDPTFPAGVWDLNGTLTGTEQLNPQQGVAWGSAAALGLIGTGAPEIAIDHILLHCDGLGDVYVTLGESDQTPAGASVEIDDYFNIYGLEYGPGVIIHQIPEPMTLTLLGLGGLFLVRRKK